MIDFRRDIIWVFNRRQGKLRVIEIHPVFRPFGPRFRMKDLPLK